MKNSYASWYESYKPYFVDWMHAFHKMVKKLFKLYDESFVFRYMIFYTVVIFLSLYSIFMLLSLFYNVPLLILISVIISYFIVQNSENSN